MSRSISHLKPWFWVASLTKLGAALKTQTITRTATGGTVDITVDGELIDNLAVVAATTAAQIKTALLALNSIDVGDVDVTGSAGGPFLVSGNIGDLVIDATAATGGTVTRSATTPPVEGDQYAVPVGALTENITGSLRSTTGWSFGSSTVDASDLNSVFPKTVPGLYESPTPSLVVYHDTDPDSRDREVEALLVEGAEGFIVRSLDGLPEIGSEVQVWPVSVMSSVAVGESDATSAAAETTTVMFSVPDAPDLHATVVA